MQMSSWEILGNYESVELVKKRYQDKHSRQLNTTGAQAITATFQQARHYYTSAKNADRAVKPLLLYYGIVSLSKGLSLFQLPSPKEIDLSNSHGLSAKGWDSKLNSENPDIGVLEVKINKTGTFKDLMKATDNRTLVRYHSSAVNACVEGRDNSAEFTVKFGDMLDRLPDIIDQLSRWRTSKSIHVTQEGLQLDGTHAFKVAANQEGVNMESVLEIFGKDKVTHAQQFRNNISVYAKFDDMDAIAADRYPSHGKTGELYLSLKYPEDVYLSKCAQLFGISFVLGMLVRYQPRYWMNLIHQRTGDAALPTILKVIEYLEMAYPIIIADFLEEQSDNSVNF